jgi:hypothetical protein
VLFNPSAFGTSLSQGRIFFAIEIAQEGEEIKKITLATTIGSDEDIDVARIWIGVKLHTLGQRELWVIGEGMIVADSDIA